MHRSVIFFWSLVFCSFGIAAALIEVVSNGAFIVLSCALGVGIVWVFLERRVVIPAVFLFAFLVGFMRGMMGPIPMQFLDPMRARLESVRDNFNASIARSLPEPQAAYLTGLLTGVRSGLPYNIADAFKKTGTSHVTALSGYNVTIVAHYIGKLSSRLPFSILGVLIFVLATGASSSVIRAAIMGILVLVARRFKHDYAVGNALLFAAVLMVMFDPRILFDDVGFQLSVAATWGLATFSDRVKKYIAFLPETLGIRESAAATLAAQAVTLPLVMFYFGAPSFYSPLVNILVLIAVPYTMFFGFFAGLAGFIHHIFASIIAWPAYLLLTYQLWIVQLFANF